MKIRNLRIGTRLGIGFGFCALLMVLMAVAAVISLRTLGQEMHSVVVDRYAKVKAFHAMSDLVSQQARLSRELLLIEKPQQQREGLERIEGQGRRIAEMLKALSTQIDDAQGQVLYQQLQQSRSHFTEAQQEFESTVRAGNREGAHALLIEQVLDRQEIYLKALAALVTQQEQQMDVAAALSQVLVRQRTAALLTAAAALAGLLLLVALFTARSITRPLHRAIGVAGNVAQGDLSQAIDVQGGDETGDLLRSLQAMSEGLGDIVRHVREGTDQIGLASSEIAQGNGDLSQRTEQQAARLQRTAGAMMQLQADVLRHSELADEARHAAALTSQQAGAGGEAVAQMVGTMQRIQAASRRIEQIVAMIDGIAFQTNILALNAAVEAARAGEQGRGFAVVAGEVRSLAQRSAQAAREIKTLITDSVRQIDDGSQLASTTGHTIDGVVQQVRRVETLLRELHDGSAAQTRGITEVKQEVLGLDSVTQQNAALVEQAAAASDSLREQAQSLVGLVARFRLQEA